LTLQYIPHFARTDVTTRIDHYFKYLGLFILWATVLNCRANFLLCLIITGLEFFSITNSGWTGKFMKPARIQNRNFEIITPRVDERKIVQFEIRGDDTLSNEQPRPKGRGIKLFFI